MTTSDDDFDLDALKGALDAAARPDPEVKAAHLRLAQENFDRLKGSRMTPRHTPDRPRGRLMQGVRDMLSTLTTRGGLTATTALVACGFLFLTPTGQELLRPDATGVSDPVPLPEVTPPPQPEATTDADVPEAEAPLEPAPRLAPAEDAQGAQTTETGPAPADAGRAIAPAQETAPLGGSTTMAAPPAATQMAPVPQATTRTAPQGFAADMAEAPVVGGIVAPEAPAYLPEPDTEAFANADQNPLKVTAEEPVSTFSIDVDTASWAVIRSSLTAGQLPPPDAVRIEEMINYFPYDYAAPEPGEGPFHASVDVFPTPWNPGTDLVRIGLQGEMPAIADRPPLNLVFLVDTSGSMADADKLPLLKQSFRLMLDQLRPEDQVAIVEYAGSAGLALPATAASDRAAILNALDLLGAGGSTNGQGGLEQAYRVAESMAEDGEVSRVILATDGDFNVGLSDPGGLEDYIAKKRDTGVYLSVLGFGRGNLDDATMQALAQNGNGTAAYIDTLSEAQKVLVDQLTGALFPIAGDVKIQVEWNPAEIAEYRLIGYETRALRREDFNNDRVDAGELGAGHSVTAIYEVTPVDSPARLTDPLRYGTAETVADASGELGLLRLRWKDPGEDASQLVETPILAGGTPDGEARFAAAIAGMGQLLRGSDYLGDWGWDEAIALAAENRGADPFGYRNEAVQLMRLAQSLSN